MPSSPPVLRTVAPVVHWRCIAAGRVQGVNYRARVAESARRLGLSGTVKNCSDGTVAIDVQGSLEAVEAFLEDVRGPRGFSHAHTVERVATLPVDPERADFEILRD